MDPQEIWKRASKLLKEKSFTPHLEDLLQEDKRIVVFSDTHLGWEEKSNVKEFDRFLDYLKDEVNRDEVGIIVANGDILEFWRRDDIEVMIENAQRLSELFKLGERCKVYWVVGNHDYRLKNTDPLMGGIPVNFPRELVLRGQKGSYRFVHGDQYDPSEIEPFFPLLCNGTDDITGEILYKIGGKILGGVREAIEKFYSLLYLKSKMSEEFKGSRKEMAKPPEERGIIEIVEENARDDVKKGEFLIFSHTHRALVDPANRVANPGSWVKGAPSENTYLEIKKGKVKLRKF